MNQTRYKNYFTLILLLILMFSKAKGQVGVENIVEKRPNILFCIADDASFQHMSAYGTTKWVNTPGFDRVAREGLLFTRAYTPNAKCAPSRACVLTGRNPWQLEAAGNHNAYFPAKFVTFMESLAENGYEVGFTGKGWSPGQPGQVNGKSRMLTGKEFNANKTEAPTMGISSTDYTANLEEFLKSKSKDKPFCFWYGGWEPHRNYEFGSGVAKGKKKLSDIDIVPPFWIDNEQVRNDMLDYAYELEYFDYHLEKMLQLLEKSGQLENTIVVVTSDNGMPFPRVKGHIYEFDNHLPLAIMWKNHIKHPGRIILDYVSFIDFAPTFLDAAGLKEKDSNMKQIQGQSIMNILSSEKGTLINAARDHVLLGRERQDVGRPNDEGYPVRGIIKDGFIYTKNYEANRWPSGNPETGYMDTDGSPTKTVILNAHRAGQNIRPWQLSFGKRPEEELYDIEKDPFSMHNLAGDPVYTKVKESLKDQMEQELTNQQDPRELGLGDIFDHYPYAQPGVRNFYERYMKGEKIKTGWINNTDFEMPVSKQAP
ncbi:sulfatase [Pedobacter heparinus]|uniref:sulfatase family protein n=1 Tax=Pedobacter heparinus TaxID=984 RepID=UPI00292D0341|nr:sulfatase [Pedobacter heparinus]